MSDPNLITIEYWEGDKGEPGGTVTTDAENAIEEAMRVFGAGHEVTAKTHTTGEVVFKLTHYDEKGKIGQYHLKGGIVLVIDHNPKSIADVFEGFWK